MRLIDADKVDFNKVFVGASDFAKDTREAAKSLMDIQPTAYDVDKVMEQIKESICRDSDGFMDEDTVIEIVKQGGIDSLN